MHLHAQSSDIAQGDDSAGNKDEGAGDQGIMFGYARRETPGRLLCPPHSQGNVGGAALRRIPGAGGKPVEATPIVVSTQHYDEKLSSHGIKAIIERNQAVWHVNPTGKFVIGGPDGDCGLTGRKIIVDTYGGAAPHGGGAFSGKDPTKVDRSAAYAARYLAKNVAAAGLADRCTIQIAYAVGVAEPLSIYVDCYGTGQVAEARLENALDEVMDLTPCGIREHLGLNRPIYARTSAYGHFGRAGAGRRLLLGTHRPRRRAAKGGPILTHPDES